MKRLLFLLFIILLGSTGCEKQSPIHKEADDGFSVQIMEQYVYEGNVDVSFVEPGGSSALYYKSGYALYHQGNRYLFSDDTMEEDRDEFVTRQMEIINFLKQQGVEVTDYTFHVVPDYENRADDEKKAAYYGITTRATMSQILATLQVVYGQYTNYGILYSMAWDIGTQLGWEVDRVDITDENYEAMINFMKKNPDYIELVYPCFTEHSSTIEAIKYSQLLSQVFYKQYPVNKEWYQRTDVELEKEHKLVAEKFIEEHQIQYVFSGKNKYTYLGSIFPIGVRTEFANVRIVSDYEEFLVERVPHYSIKGYSDIALLMDQYTEDIRIGRELVSFTDTKRANIELSTFERLPRNKLENPPGGLYFSSGSLIFLLEPYMVLHEYMHYIYDRTSLDYREWATETFAEYFSLYSNIDTINLYARRLGALMELYLEYQKDMESENEADKDRAKQNYEEYNLRIEENALKFLNIDAKKEWSDEEELLVWSIMSDLYVYENKLWNGPLDQLSNSAYLSLGFYLDKSYGRENFIKIILSEADTKKITGKIDEELKKEWVTYLIDTYSYLYNE